MSNFIYWLMFFCSSYIKYGLCYKGSTTLSIDALALQYEDDKNSMIAIPSHSESSDIYNYEFYDEMDNSKIMNHTMDMIFFGPPSSFLRIDAESILHILTHTKKHLIPRSRTLLMWDMLTDGKGASFLQGRELLALGSLLNVVPEEDLYYINFGDPSVLTYFANNHIELQPRKLGILAAAYKRYYSGKWYENSTYINEMGYLICGFPSIELVKIKPHVFKELSQETLSKAGKCNSNQTKVLYNIAVHKDVYGEPYKWSSHEILRLNALFTCIQEKDISAIQLEAVSSISPEVMDMMVYDKLEYFTRQQILRMNRDTRRVYILRTQLLNSYDRKLIASLSGVANNKAYTLILIFIAVLVVTLVI